MIVLGERELNELIGKARAAPRRRLNRNLHPNLTDPISRLANAIEPDSYIRPHRHATRWELLMVLAGSFDVVFFDAGGAVSSRQHLSCDGGARVVEYPANTWHSVVALQTGTVFFEVKQGPYEPTAPQDFMAGWPPENDPAVAAALHALKTAKVGERPSF